MAKEVLPLRVFEIDKIEKFLTSLNYNGLSLNTCSRTLNISNTERNAYKFDFEIFFEGIGKIGTLKVTWYRTPINLFKLDEIYILPEYRYDPKKDKNKQKHFGSKILNLFELKFLKRFSAIGVLYDGIKDMIDKDLSGNIKKSNPEELEKFYENRGWHKLFPKIDGTKTRYFSAKKLKVSDVEYLQKLSESNII